MGVSRRHRVSRRDFLTSSAAAAGGTIASGTAPVALSAQQAAGMPKGGRILLRGGCVLSLDRGVGDFETADVLIDAGKIAAVQPNLTAQAEVIDASNMIVLVHAVTGVRRYTRLASREARLTSPARSASRTSSSLYASSRER